MEPWGQYNTGDCTTEEQRRLNAARDTGQPAYKYIRCWEFCPTCHECFRIKKEAMTASRNQCFVCYEHLCPDCKEPRHASKADTVFRWCPMCFAEVEANDAKNHCRKKGRTSCGAGFLPVHMRDAAI